MSIEISREQYSLYYMGRLYRSRQTSSGRLVHWFLNKPVVSGNRERFAAGSMGAQSKVASNMAVFVLD